MDLWIRSQDRRDLVKVESVILCFNEEKPDNGYSLKDKSDRWYPDILGTYKTKERALEVLDEIQRLMIASLVDKNLDGYGVVIYEMPKE